MRRHHKRGTARFGCLRRFCLSTHSESFGVIRWPECDCVCAGVGLSGGRGRLLTHVHRASACTLNAVGLLPVSGRGDARVAPPCPTTLCVWRNLPYLTLEQAKKERKQTSQTLIFLFYIRELPAKRKPILDLGPRGGPAGGLLSRSRDTQSGQAPSK